MQSPSPEPDLHDGHDDQPTKRGVKRSRTQDEPEEPHGANASSSAFRNVSACNRCRSRKNRCDQNLPACSACEKAGVDCVGYDPLTKRTVPRSFVYYLETRTAYLESRLRDNGIPFAPADQFTLQESKANSPVAPRVEGNIVHRTKRPEQNQPPIPASSSKATDVKSENLEETNLVNSIGMSAQGIPAPTYLGSASFGRVLYAAVKSTVSMVAKERGGIRSSKPGPAGSTSMRDSFFGLQTKPTIEEAPLPDRELGMKLVELYFNHANPQMPILHRPQFMALFERVYGSKSHRPTSRELYLINVVFAIGAAVIFGSGVKDEKPEEYHAAAIVHLEGFLGGSSSGASPDSSGGGLEDLQAVLLLAGFALLRPVAPGLWYIVGVATRLAIDLGLHYEDGVAIGQEDLQVGPNQRTPSLTKNRRVSDKELGRRSFVRDLRRRLWWCTYCFDRMVSSCVGRPFGITDQVITTEFPSLLDDEFISPAGIVPSPDGSFYPSYKHVSYHYFRLRLLQSEIVQVLQFQQAQRSQHSKATVFDTFLHTNLPSPFLAKFNSFRQWRVDIDRRLWEWKESSPNQIDTGVQFSPLFLELNYWQAVILLYRQSLAVPFALAEEMAQVKDEVASPSTVHVEEKGDEEYVYLKIAEAAQQVLKIYRQLHRVHLVNYTYLSTHHIFQAGVSLLYALWNSKTVRSHFSLDDVDFTVLAATSVLGDLAAKCPPAEICKTAYTRMAQATIQMCLSSTGFGGQAARRSPVLARETLQDIQSSTIYRQRAPAERPVPSSRTQTRAPRFDMNLGDLFSPDESKARHFGHLQRPDATPSTTSQVVSPSSQSTTSAQVQNTNYFQQPAISPHAQPQSAIFRDMSNQQMYNEFSQNLSSTYPDMGDFNDMSFLDTFPGGSGASVASEGTNFDFDFLGLGGNDITTNHDWSEGAGMDLMDGFFFGNQSNFGNQNNGGG